STNKEEDSKLIATEKHKKKEGKTFSGKGEIKIEAKTGAKVETGNASGVFMKIDIDPENIKLLTPEMHMHLQETTAHGKKFKNVTTEGSQVIHAEPGAQVKAGDALGAVHHWKLRKEQPVLELPKSTIFSDRVKVLETFAERIFDQIKRQLKNKNLSLPSEE